jgi:hypothetical protein
MPETSEPFTVRVCRVPVGFLHDLKGGITSVDVHTEVSRSIIVATPLILGDILSISFTQRIHTENSVNNNGSPECYKGGRRGERSSPISEIYEGVRHKGQDALSGES